MRLAPRLALTFGVLAAVSAAGVGLGVRQTLAAQEAARFEKDLDGVCQRLRQEVKRQAEADLTLIEGACQDGELVDRVAIALESGELGARRISFSQIVAHDRKAFDLDELLLAVDGSDIVGASPTALLGATTTEITDLFAHPKPSSLRTAPAPALVASCVRIAKKRRVGLVGARHAGPLLERLGNTVGVEVVPSWSPKGRAGTPLAPSASASASARAAHAAIDVDGGARSGAPPVAGDVNAPELARVTCHLPALGSAAPDGADAKGPTFDVLKSTKDLEDNLAKVDRAVAIAAAVSGLISVIAATLLARSLSRPLAVLATEAGKVAEGDARPLDVKGSGEIRDLVTAFERMIADLAVTRRRLAAASRVAAWREVARQVAHEVKNPLAPIRAAVETLRRLRARSDPRFDEYFDEATRTVLDEVHRISNIVTEFTRFARLPPPRPQEFDVEDLVRHVIQVHLPTAGSARLASTTQRRVPPIRADRDQIVQVLTNLVQNALDAVREVKGGAVTVTTDTDGRYASISVVDNGVGIAPEIAARLFEPYATTKTTGTGLGLAIAQRIALEHAGELSYLGPSAAGQGAVFRLLLPIEGPPPTSETAPELEPEGSLAPRR